MGCAAGLTLCSHYTTVWGGFGLHAPAPDETIHCRFRNALVKGGVYDDLPGEVCRQLEDHGLKLKAAEAVIIAAEAAIIDATSAARPRSHIDPPQDRAEGDAPDDPDLHFSADPDARWMRKGLKSTLGYKAFARAETHAQLAMAAIGQNLLKAANKIILNPQTPAIA